jgi:hypothetical protein
LKRKSNVTNPHHEREIRATVAKVRAVFPSVPEHLADVYVSKGMTPEAAGNALLDYIGNNHETRAEAIYGARAKARTLLHGRAS